MFDGIDADAFLSRYRMFLILDEIEVEERPNAETLFTVQGPEAEARLLAAGLPRPALPGDHLLDAATGTRICRKDSSGMGGFDLLVHGAQADALQSRLHAAGLPLACAEALDALRILAGRARWPQDGSEKSMVHELGVNTEVCNFEKGCYVGQEIINRIDVKGAIQKRITALVVDGPEDLAQGTPVLLGEDPVGQVSSVARIQGQVHALGVLRKAAWAPGTALTVGDAGRGARVKG